MPRTTCIVGHETEKTLSRASDLLARSSAVDVVGTARNLSEIYHQAEHKVPNTVVLSANMALAPEFEVLNLLFQALSIRCVLWAETDPSPLMRRTASSFGLTICSMQSVLSYLSAGSGEKKSEPESKAPVSTSSHKMEFDEGFILIGASTGGVDALIRVLSNFPKNCPPTFIVQHTGSQFTNSLARLIDSHISPTVVEGRSASQPKAGVIMLAPGGASHMMFQPGRFARIQCKDGPPIHGHRPSVDGLFQSAVAHAKRVSAALLTGMGRDGADGLLALRRAGARTFGQDEKTSVVYGMPRVAREIGAVERQLPLDAIGSALLKSRQKVQNDRK